MDTSLVIPSCSGTEAKRATGIFVVRNDSENPILSSVVSYKRSNTEIVPVG